MPSFGFYSRVHLRTKKCHEIKISFNKSRAHSSNEVDAINHIRGTLREYGIHVDAGVENFYTEVLKKSTVLKSTNQKRTLLSIFEQVKQLKSGKADWRRSYDLHEGIVNIDQPKVFRGRSYYSSDDDGIALLDDVESF